MRLISSSILVLLFWMTRIHVVTSFLAPHIRSSSQAAIPIHQASLAMQTGAGEVQDDTEINPTVAEKFKVLVCSSTSCARKRKQMGMDELETYAAFFGRIQDRAPTVQVEECPCLGACKMAPAVGIEHYDYEGTVALLGMTDSEFSERVFHNILTDGDVDRVWSCVEDAIQLMSQEEEDQDEQ